MTWDWQMMSSDLSCSYIKELWANCVLAFFLTSTQPGHSPVSRIIFLTHTGEQAALSH